MKAVFVNGSPRGAASATAAMLGALEAGFRSVGAETCLLELAGKRIGFCTACHSCWSATPGACIQRDDMADLLASLSGADCLIFGTPLYFCNVSGTLKVFFDRMTASGGNPHAAGAGAAAATESRKAPGIVMVANCGFPNREQFGVVSLWIRNVAAMMRSELVGEFYATGGKRLIETEATGRRQRELYLAHLSDCGRSIAESGGLTEEQRAANYWSPCPAP